MILFSNLQKSHSSTEHIRVNYLLLTLCLFLILDVLQTFFENVQDGLILPR
jgi:hypothetical protein